MQVKLVPDPSLWMVHALIACCLGFKSHHLGCDIFCSFIDDSEDGDSIAA